MSSTTSPKNASKLLRWLILVSLIIHIPIYLHVNGLLTTEVLHYIDLTVRRGEDSSSRKIMRPPPIIKDENKSGKAIPDMATPIQVPERNNSYIEGDTPISEHISNAGVVPLPGINKMNLTSEIDDSTLPSIGSSAGLSSVGLGTDGGALTREQYIEMVRRKVERMNQFPDEQKRTSGVVTVQFLINLDGTIDDLQIWVPSPIEAFNQHALKAVRDSAPFMKPPPSLYSNPVPVKFNVFYNLY
jgi:TonB family protein